MAHATSLSKLLVVLVAVGFLGGAAEAQENRSIALILDASGSMNARLAAGGTRLDAAKTAVAAFVEKLDPRVRLSYRAYGHQSPTRDKNCRDTELLVDFGAVSDAKEAILAKTRQIKAQGYTPITHVIQLAAADVAKEPGAHFVVLVSDGQETCAGDPCAAAKALAAANAKLQIHTIGFNVDAAARYQLQCIARMARGTYTDASSAADLGASLSKVAVAPPPPAAKPARESKTSITIVTPKPGALRISKADWRGHKVTEAESGKEVASMNNSRWHVELPAGLYNVSFGPTLWKSVEVKSGEITTLDPGVLEVRYADRRGHKVLDWETGREVGSVNNIGSALTVVPSTYTVTFGKTEWKEIEVKPGERKVLNPAVIDVRGISRSGHNVYAEDGTLVGAVVMSASSMPVPPGKYTIDVGGRKVPLDLVEGQRMEINLK
jgi:Mg-chelatase subunit ChlD